MLPQEQIIDAVQIQKTSYRLLRWLVDGIDRGVINFTRRHDDLSPVAAAREWIGTHYQELPSESRPAPDQLDAFSNYFGSYVTTSFDLVEQPGKTLESECGCYCPLCSRLVNASHLQAKRPTKLDKNKARKACTRRLLALAREEGISLSENSAEQLVDSSEQRRNVAYSTYGNSLLERIQGSEGGVYVLVLWRMIAWKPEGSPIPNFRLKADDIFDAERGLIETLVGASS